MCTTIWYKREGDIFLANNEDITLENGMIFTNKQGVRKTALMMPPAEPLQWTSRYGSVTFSQCGKEFPSAGINTEGLAIEQMTLPETAYPAPAEEPAVSELQLIQFLLDTCETVDEGLGALKSVRVAQGGWPVHYMLCDRHGCVAVVEFLAGKACIRKNEALRIKALTNSSYGESLYYDENAGLIADIADPYKRSSLERFRKAADFLREVPVEVPVKEGSAVDYGFDALKAAARDDTVWQIVYDIKNRRVHFRTKRFQNIKYFDLRRFDFSKDAVPKATDISLDASGDIAERFGDYTPEANKALVYAFFRNEALMPIMKFDFPDEMLDYLAAYPEKQPNVG